MRTASLAFGLSLALLTLPVLAQPVPPPAASPAPPKPAAPAKAPALPAATGPEVWFAAKATGGAMAYNASSIKPDPTLGTVSVTSAVYLNAPLKSPSGAQFQYVVADDRLDCVGGKFQSRARIMMDTTTKIVDATDAGEKAEWQPVAGNPIMTILTRVACQGRPIAGAKQTANFPETAKMLKTLAAQPAKQN